MGMKGIVFKSTGSYYNVKDAEGTVWNCRIRGKLRIDKTIKSTNPIAVGDEVEFNIEENDNEENLGVIQKVSPRHNYIIRVSPHNKHHKHIVASNLDQAVIMATIVDPVTSFGFIDRFLITAELYHIPAILVINKADLITTEEQQFDLERKIEVYTTAGYPVIVTSTVTGEGIEALKLVLKDKRTLVSGHSGVGKSTLVNALDENLDVRVGEVSEWSGKGQHTTTFAEMHELVFGGFLIDTPGIKEFGLFEVKKEELGHYFPEIRKLMHDCRFNNCIHVNEPDCAVKDNIDTEALTPERYYSYLTIMDTIALPEY